jgi:FkbM family methyltransferase
VSQAWSRKIFAWVERLDRRELGLLRWIPASWKRKAVRLFMAPWSASPSAGPVEVDGLRLTMPEHLRGTYLWRQHEPRTRELLESLLKPGSVMVDVGANIGYHSLYAARRVGPEGRVYAVEADRTNLELLRRNIAENRLGKVVEVLPVAAGAEHRLRRFQRRGDSGHHGFYAHPTEETVEEVEVEEVPLDDLLSGPVDVVKVDVEGAEGEVLRGLGQVLAKSPGATLILEWNPPLAAGGQDLEELPRELQAQGYSFTLIDESPVEPLPDRAYSPQPPFQATDLPLDRCYQLVARRDPPPSG